MKYPKRLFNKISAVIMVFALFFSGTGTVFADSYQEIEKAALQRFIKDFSVYWDNEIKNHHISLERDRKALTLALEDSGKPILSILAGGIDVSWLDTITAEITGTVKEGKKISRTELLLNGTHILDTNVYIDSAEKVLYSQIPEYTETWTKNLFPSLEEIQKIMNEEYVDLYQDYMEVLQSDAETYIFAEEELPDTESLALILERYGNLILDNLSEKTYKKELLSAEGISEECTAYEIEITEENAWNICKAVLNTADKDEELKKLLEMWKKPDGTDLYAAFKETVYTSLEELENLDIPKDSRETLNLKVWINEDGKIKGRKLSFWDGTSTQQEIIWKSPSADGKSALLIDIYDGESIMSLKGSGENAEDVLNGEYVLDLFGEKAAVISAENVTADMGQIWNGKFSGTYTITFHADPSMGMGTFMSGFGLIVSLSSDAGAGTDQIKLSYTSSGIPLFTLCFDDFYADRPLELPDQEELDAAYDILDPEDLEAYAYSVDLSVIMGNLVSAGMPEELLDKFMDAITDMVIGDSTSDTEGTYEAAI